MNNYKSFSDLKEELGNNYDFKLYEMGISALKEIENLQQENKQLKEQLQNISNEFLKYDWKNATQEQVYNQLKGLYESMLKEVLE
jgi:hypothetical protein